MAQSSISQVSADGSGVKSKGWKKIKSMSVQELMDKLLMEKAALEIYSQEVKTTKKVIAQLVGCLDAVRAKRQALIGQTTTKKKGDTDSALRKELEETRRQLREATSMLEDKQKELAKEQQKIAELEQSCKNKDDKIDELKKSVTSLQRQIDDQKSVIVKLQEDVEDFEMTKGEVADLKSNMAKVLEHLRLGKLTPGPEMGAAGATE